MAKIVRRMATKSVPGNDHTHHPIQINKSKRCQQRRFLSIHTQCVLWLSLIWIDCKMFAPSTQAVFAFLPYPHFAIPFAVILTRFLLKRASVYDMLASMCMSKILDDDGVMHLFCACYYSSRFLFALFAMAQ